MAQLWKHSINLDGSLSAAWNVTGHPVLPLPLDRLSFLTFMEETHRNWCFNNKVSPPYFLVFETKLGEDEAFLRAFAKEIKQALERRYGSVSGRIEVKWLQMQICMAEVLSNLVQGIRFNSEWQLHGMFVPKDHIAVNRSSVFQFAVAACRPFTPNLTGRTKTAALEAPAAA